MTPTASNIAAARRSWERVLRETDADSQQVLRALWASVWARTLLHIDDDAARRLAQHRTATARDTAPRHTAQRNF